MEKQETSYQKWYRTHKKQLLKERRKRYKTDLEYREKIQQSAKARYQKKEVHKDRQVIITTSGKELITIGKLAKVINRNVQTIRNYHKTNVIPLPQSFDNRGWRLYSKKQARLIESVFKKFDEGKLKSLAEVAEVLQTKWEVDSGRKIRSTGASKAKEESYSERIVDRGFSDNS